MKLLLKTTDKMAAMECERRAASEYGLFAVYKFQYWALDGKFYYEIMVEIDEED